jgi:hypothetical protein
MMRREVLGLMLVALLVGCSGSTTTGNKPEGKNKVKSTDHEHGDGPHGGVIFDLGKYHAEFKPDHGKKEATIWILGADEKTPVPIAIDKLEVSIDEVKAKSLAAFTVELKAQPLEGEKDGKSSRFVGQHDGFAVETEYSGNASAVIDGKPSSGKFKEEPEEKK